MGRVWLLSGGQPAAPVNYSLTPSTIVIIPEGRHGGLHPIPRSSVVPRVMMRVKTGVTAGRMAKDSPLTQSVTGRLMRLTILTAISFLGYIRYACDEHERRSQNFLSSVFAVDVCLKSDLSLEPSHYIHGILFGSRTPIAPVRESPFPRLQGSAFVLDPRPVRAVWVMGPFRP